MKKISDLSPEDFQSVKDHLFSGIREEELAEYLGDLSKESCAQIAFKIIEKIKNSEIFLTNNTLNAEIIAYTQYAFILGVYLERGVRKLEDRENKLTFKFSQN